MRPLNLLIAGLVVAIANGCSREPEPTRVAVRGTLQLSGRPLSDVTVSFVPKKQGVSATANVVAGQFEISAEQGPSPGEHFVVVRPKFPEFDQAMEQIEAGKRDPLNVAAVPLAYQKPGRLKATLEEQSDNELTFELSSH